MLPWLATVQLLYIAYDCIVMNITSQPAAQHPESLPESYARPANSQGRHNLVCVLP